jgi:urease accessory protein
MLHVNKRLPQGRGLAPALLRRAATVELDEHSRGQVLRGGDVLVAEDGSLARRVAAPPKATTCTSARPP